MGFFAKLFGKKKSERPAQADPPSVAGRERIQSDDELANTRNRMEKELDGQRDRRNPTSGSGT